MIPKTVVEDETDIELNENSAVECLGRRPPELSKTNQGSKVHPSVILTSYLPPKGDQR